MSATLSTPRRAEIWLVDLGVPIGKEQGLQRPAVVVSADRLNSSRAGIAIVVPFTRSRRGYPTHVEVDPEQSPGSGLDAITYAQTENIRVVPIERLIRPLGELPVTDMSRIESALRRVLVL